MLTTNIEIRKFSTKTMTPLEEIIIRSKTVKCWSKSRLVDKDISPSDENITFSGKCKDEEISINYTLCSPLWRKYSIILKKEISSMKIILGSYEQSYWFDAQSPSAIFSQLQKVYFEVEDKHNREYYSRINRITK